MNITNILLVCVGNICRSPVAEILMRNALQQRAVQVSSAGLQALVGHAVHPSAQAQLLAHGLDGSDHRARQLDLDMLRRADLVLAMEPAHLHRIAVMAPAMSGKAMLLGKWQHDTPVADPYRQSPAFFVRIHQQIAESVAAWGQRL